MEDQVPEKIPFGEITKLTNELTYRQYLLNPAKTQDLLSGMIVPEFIILNRLNTKLAENDIYGGRIYLQEISDTLHLSVRQVSRIVTRMKNSGLITWTHDGDGTEGTYVMITENGKKLLEEKQKNINRYYSKVLKKFGKENFVQLLSLMKQLELTMNEENPLYADNEEYDCE